MRNLTTQYTLDRKRTEKNERKNMVDQLQLEATLGKLIKHAIAYEAAKNKLTLL